MDRQAQLSKYLRESRQPQKPESIEEAKKDPFAVAVRMLQNPKAPLNAIRKRLSALESAFKARGRELEGLMKLGSGLNAVDLLKRISAEELHDLRRAVEDMENVIGRVAADANRR